MFRRYRCRRIVMGSSKALWYGLYGGGRLRLREVAALTDAEPVTCQEQLELVLTRGCGADLLSDVLALVEDVGVLLITGTVGLQTVQVAQILQLGAILFVRGKCPSEEVRAFANRAGVPLLTTELSMFEACGILYGAGLKAAQLAFHPRTSPETQWSGT